MSDLTNHIHRYLLADAAVRELDADVFDWVEDHPHVAEMLAIYSIICDFDGACDSLDEAIFAIHIAATEVTAESLVSRALLLAAARYFGWTASNAQTSE